ncbi:hypothetical protein LTR66_009800 [Elasticomyces elasticus]|nr:hypothetical protein LTR66_009800 [Elasticomyces elasticus]
MVLVDKETFERKWLGVDPKNPYPRRQSADGRMGAKFKQYNSEEVVEKTWTANDDARRSRAYSRLKRLEIEKKAKERQAEIFKSQAQTKKQDDTISALEGRSAAGYSSRDSLAHEVEVIMNAQEPVSDAQKPSFNQALIVAQVVARWKRRCHIASTAEAPPELSAIGPTDTEATGTSPSPPRRTSNAQELGSTKLPSHIRFADARASEPANYRPHSPVL